MHVRPKGAAVSLECASIWPPNVSAGVTCSARQCVGADCIAASLRLARSRRGSIDSLAVPARMFDTRALLGRKSSDFPDANPRSRTHTRARASDIATKPASSAEPCRFQQLIEIKRCLLVAIPLDALHLHLFQWKCTNSGGALMRTHPFRFQERQ